VACGGEGEPKQSIRADLASIEHHELGVCRRSRQLRQRLA
jgi:hypothetical protein